MSLPESNWRCGTKSNGDSFGFITCVSHNCVRRVVNKLVTDGAVILTQDRERVCLSIQHVQVELSVIAADQSRCGRYVRYHITFNNIDI